MYTLWHCCVWQYIGSHMSDNNCVQCMSTWCRYLAGAFKKDQETCLAKVLGLYQVCTYMHTPTKLPLLNLPMYLLLTQCKRTEVISGKLRHIDKPQSSGSLGQICMPELMKQAPDCVHCTAASQQSADSRALYGGSACLFAAGNAGEQEEHWGGCRVCPLLGQGLCHGCAGDGERAVCCQHHPHL